MLAPWPPSAKRAALAFQGRTPETALLPSPGSRARRRPPFPCDAIKGSRTICRWRLSGLRSAVEHPFRVLKHQFGHTKVRYRGSSKIEQQSFGQIESAAANR
jgi:hypothetical protein